MGYLLREAFRTLCAMNQWSYAVFWKIACQNPRLLIWEDYFYEPLGLPFMPQTSGRNNGEVLYGRAEGLSAIHEACSSQSGAQAGDKLELLIKEMMANNHICIVGEGMIGRAAFSGNYQWFLSSNFSTHAHPPEVSNEMQHQFSAGIQTVAIVPVPPHGVVQLGSSLAIMENLGFLNDVKSLILQLGCIPGALFSIDSVERSRTHDTTVDNELGYPNLSIFETSKQLGNDSHSSSLINGQFLPGFQNIQESSNGSPVQSPHHPHILAKPRMANPKKPGFPLRNQVDSNVVRAEVIPSNPNSALHQLGVSVGANSGRSHQVIPDVLDDKNCIFNSRKRNIDGSVLKPNKISDFNHLESQMSSLLDTPEPSLSNLTQSGFQEGGMAELDGIPLFNLSDQLMTYATQVLSGGSSSKINPFMDRSLAQTELPSQRDTLTNTPSLLTHRDDCTSSVEHTTKSVHVSKKHRTGNSPISSNDVSLQQSMGNGGNDLFDVFGVHMKDKLFGGKLGNPRADLASAATCSVGELSESGVFSVTGTDNLLDAVVSGAISASKQSSDDSLSCKTTLTKISSCSIPRSSSTYVQSDQVQGNIIGFPRPQTKEGILGCGGSVGSGLGKKNEVSTCSKSNSICSWVEQGNPENSVLTGHSKRPDGPIKASRKRMKPGENPRPRPKDRQLIQDRLKELRDIVPNGAKCSIDALLERTVKHMEFLQGVTKHGDKLKHIGESRINNDRGRLLSKDKHDGGATYAFEIGSDSMFCPVIVEDLNPPRQFQVEMLCEEQGFFLEIADMIRGLGLTILKGVLESRNDKTRARFAVEANRDVTRMDLFLSLVHLFEETMKGKSSSSNAFDENLKAHHPFAQPSVVPTTYMQQ